MKAENKSKKYIYESSDGGKTIYRRESGKDERVLIFFKGKDI